SCGPARFHERPPGAIHREKAPGTRAHRIASAIRHRIRHYTAKRSEQSSGQVTNLAACAEPMSQATAVCSSTFSDAIRSYVTDAQRKLRGTGHDWLKLWTRISTPPNCRTTSILCAWSAKSQRNSPTTMRLTTGAPRSGDDAEQRSSIFKHSAGDGLAR